MLKQAQKVVKTTPQLEACYSLKNYMEGKFKERMDKGQVDFNYIVSDCGTYRCLWGWYVEDVLKDDVITLWHADNMLGFPNRSKRSDVLGVEGVGTYTDRLNALNDHITNLEQEAMV